MGEVNIIRDFFQRYLRNKIGTVFLIYNCYKDFLYTRDIGYINIYLNQQKYVE